MKGKPEELNSFVLQSFGNATTGKTREIFFTQSDLLCNIAVLLAQFSTNINLLHQIPQYIISTSLFWQVRFLLGGRLNFFCELFSEKSDCLEDYFRIWMDLYWRWILLSDKSGHLPFLSDLFDLFSVWCFYRRQIIKFVTTKLFPSRNHYWIKTTLSSKLLFEFIFYLIAFYILDFDFTELLCFEKLNPIHFDELYQSWILITTGC